MLRQILFGVAISLSNIAVHAVAMAMVISAGRAAAATYSSSTRATVRLIAVMIAIVSVLMAAHVVEIGVWSLAYAMTDVVPPEADRFYFAFVNFTTLGYGDVLPMPRWRLLGPMTAMNGVLLFGWSTALIFEVLRTTLHTGAITAPPLR